MTMFCFQCEEATKGTGCTTKGICGKTERIAVRLKHVLLGPTLLAFLSPNVVKVLIEHLDIKPIGNVQEDVMAMMMAA
ncbi:MAG: hypothetical protein K9L82_19120 [Chromatiaceae bacterium]|nr:hypothetical protein [Chromatiaceae bacterium]MCF7997233.1 hypothetical protein [Chromatiaceae bacterium]